MILCEQACVSVLEQVGVGDGCPKIQSCEITTFRRSVSAPGFYQCIVYVSDKIGENLNITMLILISFVVVSPWLFSSFHMSVCVCVYPGVHPVMQVTFTFMFT